MIKQIIMILWLLSSFDIPQFFSRVSTPNDGEFTKEQLIEDEAVDCQIIKFLKKEILSQSNSVPKEFVLKVVMLLTKGSVLSPAHDVIISEYFN